jgi:hypothetical protein
MHHCKAAISDFYLGRLMTRPETRSSPGMDSSEAKNRRKSFEM